MRLHQPAILAPIPLVGRYLFFSLAPVPINDLRDRLARLAGIVDGTQVLVGFGPQILQALESEVPGLHQMQSITGHGIEVPCTPSAVCCWLRGSDRGDLIHLSRQLEKALAPVLRLDHAIDAFRHGTARDLTGYEDGIENPVDDAAKAAALVHNAGAGLDGSSFMAVQQWMHDFDAFEAMSTTQQDNSIGRRRSDNKELEQAPSSAHVKRTTQEDFDPPAFVLRRSMPWVQDNRAGLMFVAFGKSFDAFEAQLRRMAGVDDSVTDALFRFSKPVTGAFFWCPPMKSGRLDLRSLSL
jgi:putative iron-dependent peroxidase